MGELIGWSVFQGLGVEWMHSGGMKGGMDGQGEDGEKGWIGGGGGESGRRRRG